MAEVLPSPDAAPPLHRELQESDGVTHGVDVEAETLYEAAGLGLARLKKDGWIEGLGPGFRKGEAGHRRPPLSAAIMGC